MSTKVKYEVYIMNVPFNNSYKDVVYFSSRSAQAQAFIDRANATDENGEKLYEGHHYTNLNVIVKNGTFRLRGRWDSFNRCNYMMYRYTTDYTSEDNFTSDWFYSFITDVSYNTRLGTVISHTTDVWQTYHYSADFSKKTMIERGHIHTDDATNISRWLAPEPFNSPSIEEKEINIFSDLDFTPILICETLSEIQSYSTNGTLYDVGQTLSGCTVGNYKYGGIKNSVGQTILATDVSGIYRYELSNPYRFFELYTLPEVITGLNNISVPSYNKNSHLSDIISIKAFPQFATGNSLTAQFGLDGSVAGQLFDTVSLVDEEDTITITRNSGTLACGYEPHNPKLYTSLANCYKVFNYNGVSIPIKNELLKNNHIKIRINMSNYGDSIKLHLMDYKNLKVFFDIPYTYSFNFGYNANTGVTQAQKISNLMQQEYNTDMRSLYGYSKAITDFGTGAIQSGGAFFANESMGTQYSQTPDGMAEVNSQYKGFVGGLSQMASVGTTLAKTEQQIRNDTFQYNQMQADAWSSIGISIGNNSGDRTSLDEKYWKLRLAQCSPLYDECRQIDEFLDRYGYAINELMSPSYFISSSGNRPHWNYIKTVNSQIKTDSPNNDNVIFNGILNSGTTVWKSIGEVGNYSLKNGW